MFRRGADRSRLPRDRNNQFVDLMPEAYNATRQIAIEYAEKLDRLMALFLAHRRR